MNLSRIISLPEAFYITNFQFLQHYIRERVPLGGFQASQAGWSTFLPELPVQPGVHFLPRDGTLVVSHVLQVVANFLYFFTCFFACKMSQNVLIDLSRPCVHASLILGIFFNLHNFSTAITMKENATNPLLEVPLRSFPSRRS